MRLFILGLFISALSLSANSQLKHPDDIRYSETNSIAVFGFADYKAVEAYLAPYGLVPSQVAPGLTIVAVNIIDNGKVEGCGCPNSFKDSYVQFTLAPFADSKRFATTYTSLYTDHAQRMISMGLKYGAQYELAKIDLDLEAEKFSVVDGKGANVFDIALVRPEQAREFRPSGAKLIAQSLGSLQSGEVEYKIDFNALSNSMVVTNLQATVSGNELQYTSDQADIKINVTTTMGALLVQNFKFAPFQIDLHRNIEVYQSKSGSLED